MYDGEGNVTAKYHVGKFDDFIDLEEVDYEDVKMRLFAARACLGKPKSGINIYLLGLFKTLQLSKLHSWIDGMISRFHYKSCPSTIILKSEVLSPSMIFPVGS